METAIRPAYVAGVIEQARVVLENAALDARETCGLAGELRGLLQALAASAPLRGDARVTFDHLVVAVRLVAALAATRGASEAAARRGVQCGMQDPCQALRQEADGVLALAYFHTWVWRAHECPAAGVERGAEGEEEE